MASGVFKIPKWSEKRLFTPFFMQVELRTAFQKLGSLGFRSLLKRAKQYKTILFINGFF